VIERADAMKQLRLDFARKSFDARRDGGDAADE
jgi:hypothetical protein